MPNIRALSNKELILIYYHWRRQAFAGSAHALSEALRHETELRRRFGDVDQASLQNELLGFDPDTGGMKSAIVIAEETGVTTADVSASSNDTLRDLLYNSRVLLNMDIAFVAEFVGNAKIYRQVVFANDAETCVRSGHSVPLETTLCKRVVDGRMPQVMQDARADPEMAKIAAAKPLDIGAYLSVPVVLRDGSVYGTLCCISHTPRSALGSLQIDSLRYVAVAVAAEIEKNR